MPKRYDDLPAETSVFRSVRTGGGFLPIGHVLPKPEWLEPTKEDVAEAQQSGRSPGLSVWDVAVASHEDACWWRGAEPHEQRSFQASVERIVEIGEKHSRTLSVVGDALATKDEPRLAALEDPAKARLIEAASGHSLIEGIKRPTGTSKLDHKSLREELARQFVPLSSESGTT